MSGVRFRQIQLIEPDAVATIHASIQDESEIEGSRSSLFLRILSRTRIHDPRPNGLD